jgi:hypothetical protein
MKHKSIFAALVLSLTILATADVAQARGGPGDKTFGLGLALGTPTGITGKVFFNDIGALVFGAGFPWPYAGFGGWVDGNFHFYKIRNKREDVLKMSLYAGPGLQFAFAGSYYYSGWWGYRGPRGPVYTGYYVGGPFSLAIRGPFGFAIHWQKVTFDTFVEVGPAIYVVFANPVVVFPAPLVSVGARYYF